jgi:molybdate/tungstate transport system permease protein
MNQRWNLTNVSFALAGLLAILLITVPLANTLFYSPLGALLSALADREVQASIQLTFASALIAVGIGMFTGVPLAYLLAKKAFWGREWVLAIINIPVIIPHTAAGVALLLVFGRRGLLGQWLAPLGITFTDNLGGIVVAMIFVSIPFLINASRDAFAAINQEYEQAAYVDGATPWQVFRRITLPLSWRGILAGALLMWARGVSEFGAVVILAYHPKIVPVLVYERFQGFGLSAAQPVAALLIIVSLFAFGLLNLALLPHRNGG